MNEEVFSEFGWLSAFQPIRWVFAAIGEHGDLGIAEEFKLTHHAIATAIGPLTAGRPPVSPAIVS